MPVPQPNILISINASWNIVNFRRGLVAGLQEAGFRVSAIAPPDSFTAAVRELGVDFHPIEMDKQGTSPARDLALYLRYRALLGRLRPDVFLGYTIKPNIYGSLAAHAHGIPVINNVAGLGVTFMRPGALNRLVRTMYKTALRRSHHVFFQNPDDRAIFTGAGIVPERKTSLLPGSGIDLGRFAPGAERRAQGRSFTFLLVSRLLWAKGVGEYVAAAERLRARSPGLRFQIAGILEPGRSGAVPAAELQRWQEQGTIEYLGALTDVRPAMIDADCVVLPSYYPEGTPRSLLEAAAMGKPLITCDVPGCREIVHDGANGFLCRPRDVNDLISAIERIVALEPDALARMGENSRNEAEQRFDEQIVVRRYIAAVDAALGTRSRR
ncbi:glycosyltransferase family 4 protein [Allosphingosinicella sp.]|uniref:glycosyltransferase family 4 protein n=1 Tax=Allosphingosinicella sp. TaxID=2823234 RepID=UPI003D7594E6